MKFKIGDRVRLTRNCDGDKKGDTGILTSKDGKCWYIEGMETFHSEDHLELAAPSWDNLQVGDVVVDKTNEAMVLAVLGNVFLISYWSNFERVNFWATIAEAQVYGWTLKDSETDDITELTLEEVAKLANVDVTKLRIKE